MLRSIYRSRRNSPLDQHIPCMPLLTSSEEEEFDTNQLSIHKASRSHTGKITTVLTVSGIKVEMEVDTGAEVSTMSMAVCKQKLSHIRLCPSMVRLHQYDGTTLPTKCEMEVVVTTDHDQQSITGQFVIVDIPNDQLPLLGRDWLLKLRLDWPFGLHYWVTAQYIRWMRCRSKRNFVMFLRESWAFYKGLKL